MVTPSSEPAPDRVCEPLDEHLGDLDRVLEGQARRRMSRELEQIRAALVAAGILR